MFRMHRDRQSSLYLLTAFPHAVGAWLPHHPPVPSHPTLPPSGTGLTCDKASKDTSPLLLPSSCVSHTVICGRFLPRHQALRLRRKPPSPQTTIRACFFSAQYSPPQSGSSATGKVCVLFPPDYNSFTHLKPKHSTYWCSSAARYSYEGPRNATLFACFKLEVQTGSSPFEHP